MIKTADDKQETKEELVEQLRERVKLRDQMGGDLYWNILNDECCQLASKAAAMGADRAELGQILGPGTYC